MKMFDVEVELGDELMIGGLSVFPLTGARETGPAYLTGPEAFEAGLIQVSELDPPEVPSLAIFNLGLVPILLVEGEMLVGGDQNRTMNVTVLCPPQVRTVVPVSCVEAGRWGKRRTVSASMLPDHFARPRRRTWSQGPILLPAVVPTRDSYGVR